MFLLREPSEETISRYLARQQEAPLSYAELGATRDPARANDDPQLANYNFDHNRVRLGHGAECFERAKQALRAWRMFHVSWCRIRPEGAPFNVTSVVAVVVNHFGFWSLNPARIVYVLDDEGEPGNIRRFGFAYGTLVDHSEVGEERFSVEWNRDNDTVWYDLFAFSHPAHFLAKLGYPISRMLQKRFARDSKTAMVRAIQEK